MPGKLVICPTPIGNLDDMPPRALEALRTADVVCAEDTRVTGKLLAALGIERKRLERLDENVIGARAARIVERVQAGETIAYCTDAGMPGVSDPGYRLIQALKAAGVGFTVLPGPSAVVTALVGSGLPCDAFFFGGFLPVKSGKKSQVLAAALAASHTSIFYESPFRIVKTVKAVAELDAAAPICVARELTKVFETYHRGSAAELLAEFESHPPKGEMVLLIGGTNAPR